MSFCTFIFPIADNSNADSDDISLYEPSSSGTSVESSLQDVENEVTECGKYLLYKKIITDLGCLYCLEHTDILQFA